MANRQDSPAITNEDGDPNTLQEMVDADSMGDMVEEDLLTLDPSMVSPSTALLFGLQFTFPYDVDVDVDVDDVPESVAQDPTLPPNFRDLSALASWTVSTFKPNCGVHALRSHSPMHYWQSDGPQPHILTCHFVKMVKIVMIRVYLDFSLDESYTPTRMSFHAGTSLHDLLEFGEWHGEEPKGWVTVDLDGVGIGGKAELRAWILQIRVLENHQNGKDTHVRGVQVLGRDEEESRHVYGWDKAAGERSEDIYEADEEAEGMEPPGEPEWMSMPEIR